MDLPDCQSEAPGLTVIIPACNEEGGVAGVVEAVKRILPGTLADLDLAGDAWEVIVVDDGSSDTTALKAAEAGARVIAHRQNIGYGAALKTGLRRAKFDTIVITDADSTYPVEEIPALVALLRQADMAVGSRTGAEVHIPTVRRPAKWLLKQTAQFLAGQKIPDLNSGLRVFRRADALRFHSLYPRGFSFTTTITLAYLSSDLLVAYHPINYNPRTGKSKIRPIRDTKNLFLTVIRSILLFNPLRVCIPLGTALVALALVIAIGPRDAHGNIYDGTITILIVCALQIIIVGFLADILARLRR